MTPNCPLGLMWYTLPGVPPEDRINTVSQTPVYVFQMCGEAFVVNEKATFILTACVVTFRRRAFFSEQWKSTSAVPRGRSKFWWISTHWVWVNFKLLSDLTLPPPPLPPLTVSVVKMNPVNADNIFVAPGRPSFTHTCNLRSLSS